MTDQQHPGEATAYAWMTAPAHLKTRRQLRAAGLRPNGQDPADTVVRHRRGRTLVARLFDVRLAAPKRTATPAQLDATRKATRERQLRAAERRGISRAELLDSDPGPAWAATTTEPHHLGGNPVMIDRRDALADYRDRDYDYDDHTRWPDAAPAGRGQRQTYLYATAAVHQARRMRARIAQAQQLATPENVERIDADLAAARRQAVARMSTVDLDNPAALVGALAEGLAWGSIDDHARHTTEQITSAWADQWGVVVDTEQLHVGIDPALCDTVALDAQAADEAAALWRREIRAARLAAERTSNPQARTALDTWVSLAGGLKTHHASIAERRAALETALDDAGLDPAERASVEFAVDYLRGDTTSCDLAAAPVEVDPGEEVRSQASRLLREFAWDRANAAEVTREIAVMTPADQATMREAGRAITAGTQQPDTAVWPGYADRAELTEQIRAYARDAADMAGDADWLAWEAHDEQTVSVGLDDDIGERIERMATQRAQLVETLATDRGLAAIERDHALAVLDDIDTGRITAPEQLPDLMWADERSRREADTARIVDPPADELTEQLRTEIGEKVTAAQVTGRPAFEVRDAISSLTSAVRWIATDSSPDPDRGRGFYQESRTRLGHALTVAGVAAETKQQIRTVVTAAAQRGAELGKAAAERGKTWNAKTAAACAARDGAAQASRLAADQAVVDLGRAQAPAKACANRPAQTAQTGAARPRTSGRAIEEGMNR